ncbi:MAG: energy transducer TonB, partial [Acidobacteriaceae bacterium]|nr:energy transducer TonB [Acidobacteriaceae bacterium]
AFRQSAMEAVRRWKYKPAVLNGQPVDSSAEITLNFAAR